MDIEGPFLERSDVCEPILRSLPRWFAIERAIVHYIKDIEKMPTWIASATGEIGGFLTIKRHNTYSAEIHVMAVRSEQHRKGIGKGLIQCAEEFFRNDGAEYLQVKTLSESRPDEGYAATRAFYAAMGFRPLEEFIDLWDKDNPCLLLIKRL